MSTSHFATRYLQYPREDARLYMTPAVLSALRGPDSATHYPQQVVKSIVVARIRAVVFAQYPGDSTGTHFAESDVEHITTAFRDWDIDEGEYHFLSHVESAMENLELLEHPIFVTPIADAIRRAICRRINYAYKQVVKAKIG